MYKEVDLEMAMLRATNGERVFVVEGNQLIPFHEFSCRYRYLIDEPEKAKTAKTGKEKKQSAATVEPDIQEMYLHQGLEMGQMKYKGKSIPDTGSKAIPSCTLNPSGRVK